MEPQEMNQSHPSFASPENYLNYLKQQFFLYFYSECQRKGMSGTAALQEANNLANEYVQTNYLQPYMNSQQNTHQQIMFQQQQAQLQQLQQQNLQQQQQQQTLHMLKTSPSTQSTQSTNQQQLQEQQLQAQLQQQQLQQQQLQQQQLQQQQLQQQYLYQQQQQALIQQYNTSHYELLNSSRNSQIPSTSAQSSWHFATSEKTETPANLSTSSNNTTTNIASAVTNSIPTAISTSSQGAITLPANRNKRPSVQIILNNSRKMRPQVSSSPQSTLSTQSVLAPNPSTQTGSPPASNTTQSVHASQGAYTPKISSIHSSHFPVASPTTNQPTSLPSDSLIPNSLQNTQRYHDSRFDLAAQQAALKRAQEGARAIEERHKQGATISQPLQQTHLDINGKNSGLFKLDKSHITDQEKDQSNTFLNKSLQSNQLNNPDKNKSKSSDLAFSDWLQKVYALHDQNKSIEWRKCVFAYNKLMINKFKTGAFYNVHWSTEPIPDADEILRMVKEDEASVITTKAKETKPMQIPSNHNDEARAQIKNHSKDSPSDSSMITDSDNDTGRSRQISINDDNSTSDFIPIVKGNKKQLRTKTSIKKNKKAFHLGKDPGFEQKKREQRLKRFGNASDDLESASNEKPKLISPSNSDKIMPPLGALNWQERLKLAKTPLKVIGMSNQLEKSFLRLTSLPNPENVRPIEILKKAFVYVQEQYSKNNNWAYIEEQFRSIRQDLAVQAIKNEFTVEVYETNARLALSNHDLGQFNQCQTQLRELYKSIQSKEPTNHTEFLCYRIIYMSLQNMKTHLLKVIAEIEESTHNVKEIVFAHNLRRAIVEGNWRRYFRLATNGPFKTKDLCDIFQDKMRLGALLSMTKSSLSLDPKRVMLELFFPSYNKCMEFLDSNKTVYNENGMIDSKLSSPIYLGSPLLNSRKNKAMG